MARGFSVRYLAARLRLALDEALSEQASSVTDMVARAKQAYQRDLTGLLYVTGNAMAPTLNEHAARTGAAAAAASQAGADRLLVRWLHRPSARSVFAGDVVAFASPLARPDPEGVAQPAVLVRRVAATEGEEMVSDDPEDVGWLIPEGHCWVLADNEVLPPREAVDSRVFGPLPFCNVLGRVLYHASSPARHGPVENSLEAADVDGPVLAAELDVEEFVNGSGRFAGDPPSSDTGKDGEGAEQRKEQRGGNKDA